MKTISAIATVSSVSTKEYIIFCDGHGTTIAFIQKVIDDVIKRFKS